VQASQRQAGRFVLATNQLDKEFLGDEQLLIHYKQQQGIERGFRFLKDPLFFASSLFLKTPERIMALAFIMALCLLVYNLGQRQLRLAPLRARGDGAESVGKADSASNIALDFSMFEGDSLGCTGQLSQNYQSHA
jgi:transposase